MTKISQYQQNSAWKSPVRLATTANITLSGTQTIDGVAGSAGNRILVKNQSITTENGIYVMAAGSWTRAIDYDNAADIVTGAYTYVAEGNANGGSLWHMSSTGITVGASAQTWVSRDKSIEDLDMNSNDIIKIKTACFDGYYNIGNSGASKTIDWNNGNKQGIRLTDNCTLTFTAPAGPTNLMLEVQQDNTGSRTVTWPGAVEWPAGTAPTLTTTAYRTDLISFYYNGTYYFGNSSLNYILG